MSEVSSRSKVQSVSCAGIVATAGIALVGALVVAAIDALGETSRQKGPRPSRRRPASSKQNPGAIEVLPALETRRVQLEETMLHQFQRQKLGPAQALKTATLQSFELSQYMAKQREVEPLINNLIAAQDLATAEKARSILIDTTREQHRQILERSLTQACRNAAIEVGFDRIEVARGPLNGIRVIAINSEGKTLISEIDSGDCAAPPKIESEVVGGCDHSCTSILDAFDDALTHQGVRSGPPARKHTGGVAKLDAAREFLRNRVHSVPAPRSQLNAAANTKRQPQSEARRVQQLNKKEVQKQR